MGKIGMDVAKWTCPGATPFQEFRGRFATKHQTFEPHLPARKVVPKSMKPRGLRLSRGDRRLTFPNDAMGAELFQRAIAQAYEFSADAFFSLGSAEA